MDAKTLIAAISLCASAAICPAGEELKVLLAVKDGIALFVRAEKPFNPRKPVMLVDFENRTDTAVSFQLQGGDVPPMFVHLYDAAGNEIKKEVKWIDWNESMETMHVRRDLFPAGETTTLKVLLNEAFADRWLSGASLKIVWNPNSVGLIRRGPMDSLVGLGRGLEGTFEMSPLTGVVSKTAPGSATDSRQVPGTSEQILGIGKPLAVKDGIALFVRAEEPFDHEKPVMFVEFENGTDSAVWYGFQGSEVPPMFVHLYDESGNEIAKEAGWVAKNETLSNTVHSRLGLLPPHEITTLKVELEKAFGDRWISGALLKIVWNPNEVGPVRPGPAGWLGIGRGLEGTFVMSPLTGVVSVGAPKEEGDRGESRESTDHVLRPDSGSGEILAAETPDTKPAKRQMVGFDDATAAWLAGFLALVGGLAVVWLRSRRREM